MHPNPALRKLGFADDARVAIIHADDIGMCQANLTAFNAWLVQTTARRPADLCDLRGYGTSVSGIGVKTRKKIAITHTARAR